ncbi:hypothetical protein R3W88_031915 [Solanum pinnatisectum]|uniref:DM2 domain-containing protein n=1 Tax=Solanum pinnatisectum TaxID=50273 RepID=A0AAV9LMZ8_9SOLN|nr:hypothetical protein R3W88_031915 [Solanum pinnatisectum]
MAAAKTSAGKSSSATTTIAARKGRSKGILKPQPISPALQKFVGTSVIYDTVKKIWDYIKTNNLQVHFPSPLHVTYDRE